MEAGTFQGGLKTTVSICEANMGVFVDGAPTMMRMSRVGTPSTNNVARAAPTSASIRVAGNGRGSHRHRSRLASICESLAWALTFRAA